MVYLLDVNVLLALADPLHIHHEAAHRWFAGPGRDGWATCPLTENAFLRIASHPSYPNRPGDIPAVAAILGRFRESRGHQFWADDVSILEVLAPSAIVTHSQVTDVYLLGLAVRHKARLATFDRHIPADAVPDGKAAIEMIAL